MKKLRFKGGRYIDHDCDASKWERWAQNLESDFRFISVGWCQKGATALDVPNGRQERITSGQRTDFSTSPDWGTWQ